MSVYRDQRTGPAPDVLICSGLDPSGGAGFLADARVVHALGGRPVGAITTMTVQDTLGLRSVHEIDVDVLGAQLDAVMSDIEIAAVKIGMLGDADVVRVLDETFALTDAPVVWDPIAGATRGVQLSRALLEGALRTLGPHLTLITPNVHELEILAGVQIASRDAAIEQARLLARVANVAVLVTSAGSVEDESERARESAEAQAPGGAEVIDVLCLADGEVELLRGARIIGDNVHGTGCALSSAIATYLALGHPIGAACREAKRYVATLIGQPAKPGRGAPAIL